MGLSIIRDKKVKIFMTLVSFKQDTLKANGPNVTPMSALTAEVEAVEAEDMEVGLDYWLPGDVELQKTRLQQTRESFDPLSGFFSRKPLRDLSRSMHYRHN